MAQHDTDAEIVNAVRAVIDDQFGRYLGEGISTTESARVIDALQSRGVVLFLGAPPEMPTLEAPEFVLPALDAGPAVVVNVNVSATPDTLPAVLAALAVLDTDDGDSEGR